MLIFLTRVVEACPWCLVAIGGKLASAETSYMLKVAAEKLLAKGSIFIFIIERVAYCLCYLKNSADRSFSVGIGESVKDPLEPM